MITLGRVLFEKSYDAPIRTTVEEANALLAECTGKLLAAYLEEGYPLILVEIAEVITKGKVITWRVLLHEASDKQETIDLGE